MAAPPPEHLGPIGAYLASDDFGWCSGEILFSNGAEVSLVAAPRILEAVRTTGVPSVARTVAAAVPTAFAGAEAAQVSTGGSVPRLGAAFADDDGSAAGTDSGARRCLLVVEDPEWHAAIAGALATHGATCTTADPSVAGFDGAAAEIERAAADGPVDAVVVALAESSDGARGDAPWQQIVDAHRGLPDAIRRDAGWVRAVSDHSARTQRAVRVVTVTAATSAGGQSRAMAAAQLARSAHTATDQRVDAFGVAVESDATSARTAAAALVAHLVDASDAAALSGAELVVDAEWIGLRSHPTVAGTVTYGGPELPEWLDRAVRRVVGVEPAPHGDAG